MTFNADMLFYLVFVGQVFLISFILPGKVSQRMQKLMASYPPEQYPKLYPRPVEYYRMGQAAFRLANRAIFFLGFGVLALAIFVDDGSLTDDGYISEAWPFAYGMLQVLPLMLLEFMEFSNFKLMREANTATVRKAQLRRRGLVDYASPLLVIATIAVCFIALAFDFLANGMVIEWDKTLVLVFANGFLAAIALWNVHGQKIDPYQDTVDRVQKTAATVKSLLFVSIAMNVFYMTRSADQLVDIAFLDATVMSVYFQAITLLTIGNMLRSLRLEDINFDVYRADGVGNAATS